MGYKLENEFSEGENYHLLRHLISFNLKCLYSKLMILVEIVEFYFILEISCGIPGGT